MSIIIDLFLYVKTITILDLINELQIHLNASDIFREMERGELAFYGKTIYQVEFTSKFKRYLTLVNQSGLKTIS